MAKRKAKALKDEEVDSLVHTLHPGKPITALEISASTDADLHPSQAYRALFHSEEWDNVGMLGCMTLFERKTCTK